MGSEWKERVLSDLISVKHGWAFKGSFFDETENEGPIVVAIGNFDYSGGFRFSSTKIKRYTSDYPIDYELVPGEILLAMTCQTAGGEILGIPGRIPADGNTYLHNQRLGKVVVESEDVDDGYLYWLFLSRGFNYHLYCTATGTKILHTAPERILKYKFSLPPLPEQRAIAHILGSLDDKIELNRRMNATLEGMAQALFKSWFVDFDPVIDQALAAGEPIPEPLRHRAEARRALGDKRKPLPAAIQQQFPSRFVFNEELGWVPEGWEVKSLDHIANYQNGLALQKFRPEDENEFLPVVKIAQLRKGYADGEEKASPNIKPECIIDDSDVVFSWSGSLMIDIWCGGKAALNQHLFKVTSKTFPKWFYYQYTLHHLHEFQRIAAAKAVTMGHIKREHLKQALCAVPSTILINKCSGMMDEWLNKGIGCRVENKTLTNLRDTLLPKLLSGQLRIPEAEKLIEGAL